MAIFFSRTNMSTFKDARTLLPESFLDGVIDDDEFILLYDETVSKNSEHPGSTTMISCPTFRREENSTPLAS